MEACLLAATLSLVVPWQRVRRQQFVDSLADICRQQFVGSVLSEAICWEQYVGSVFVDSKFVVGSLSAACLLSTVCRQQFIAVCCWHSE